MSEIIEDSLSLINAMDDGEPIPADMWNYGKCKLNQLMSFLSMNKGLWLIEEVSVTLTPGTESYTIGVGETVDNPKPMQISHARETSDQDIPIEVTSREDYMSIPDKDLQARATTVYYHPGRDTGTLYVWPTGTSTKKTIQLTTQRPVQDFDTEGNNPDFPKEWTLPITYILATMIAPKYLGGEVPSAISSQASVMYAALTEFDEEKTSIFIQ